MKRDVVYLLGHIGTYAIDDPLNYGVVASCCSQRAIASMKADAIATYDKYYSDKKQTLETIESSLYEDPMHRIKLIKNMGALETFSDMMSLPYSIM